MTKVLTPLEALKYLWATIAVKDYENGVPPDPETFHAMCIAADALDEAGVDPMDTMSTLEKYEDMESFPLDTPLAFVDDGCNCEGCRAYRESFDA